MKHPQKEGIDIYFAYITTIKDLRKHENADRLQCATIFGNNVIVDMSYKVGQRIIYFPVDGQVGADFARDNNLLRVKDENGNNCGGYLDPEKRNITALKLRGEKSDGLALPIESLSKYVDISTLSDGEKISILNGVEICRKYIPRDSRLPKSGVKGKAKNKKNNHTKRVTCPFFAEHADTSQLAFNEKAFKPGDTCYITLKMHGTSARTGNTLVVKTGRYNQILKKVFHMRDKTGGSYKVVSGTRRCVLENYDKGGWYGSNAFREKYHNLFKDKLPKGVEVFYEIVGWVDGEKNHYGKVFQQVNQRQRISQKIWRQNNIFIWL